MDERLKKSYKGLHNRLLCQFEGQRKLIVVFLWRFVSSQTLGFYKSKRRGMAPGISTP